MVIIFKSVIFHHMFSLLHQIMIKTVMLLETSLFVNYPVICATWSSKTSMCQVPGHWLAGCGLSMCMWMGQNRGYYLAYDDFSMVTKKNPMWNMNKVFQYLIVCLYHVILIIISVSPVYKLYVSCCQVRYWDIEISGTWLTYCTP